MAHFSHLFGPVVGWTVSPSWRTLVGRLVLFIVVDDLIDVEK